MKHIALIAASSIAALAATVALAQPQPVPPAAAPQAQERSQDRTQTRDQRREEWRQQRAERARARLDERLAKVRDELKLKPEQAPLWDKVEALIKQRSTQGAERWAQMRDERERLRSADLMERIDARASRLGQRAAASKELADAVRPLWATLSDEQKTVLRRSVRQAMSERRDRFREMREWRRGGPQDHDRGQRHWRDDNRRDRDWRGGDRDDSED